MKGENIYIQAFTKKAAYGKVATEGLCQFLLIAKDTTDDKTINPVSPLPTSLSIPSISQSFYR